MPGALTVAVPVSRVALNGDAKTLGPCGAEPVSPSRLALNKGGDPVLAMHAPERPFDQRFIGKIAPTSHDNSHGFFYHKPPETPRIP